MSMLYTASQRFISAVKSLKMEEVFVNYSSGTIHEWDTNRFIRTGKLHSASIRLLKQIYPK